MLGKKEVLIFVFILTLLSATSVSASRLPTVGGDSGTWGTVLNDYLNVSHNESGELRASTISAAQITDGTITDADIADTINLTLGEKITFALGEIIDNIVDGWIRVAGGLNVTGNIETAGNATADYFLGNGSQLTDLTESQITDLVHTVNGTNINVLDVNASSAIIHGDLNVTGTSYLGDITITADNITTNGVVSKDGNITFYNNVGSENVRITNDGKVGIGTTNPDYTLDVNGNASFDYIQNITGIGGSDGQAVVFADKFNGSNMGEKIQSAIDSFGATGGHILVPAGTHYAYDNGAGYAIVMDDYITVEFLDGARLYINGGFSAFYFPNTCNNAILKNLYIDGDKSSGNVGVEFGTSSTENQVENSYFYNLQYGTKCESWSSSLRNMVFDSIAESCTYGFYHIGIGSWIKNSHAYSCTVGFMIGYYGSASGCTTHLCTTGFQTTHTRSLFSDCHTYLGTYGFQIGVNYANSHHSLIGCSATAATYGFRLDTTSTVAAGQVTKIDMIGCSGRDNTNTFAYSVRDDAAKVLHLVMHGNSYFGTAGYSYKFYKSVKQLSFVNNYAGDRPIYWSTALNKSDFEIAHNFKNGSVTEHSGFKALGDIDMDGHDITNAIFYGSGKHLENIDLTKSLVLNMPFQAGSPTKDFSGEGNDGTVSGATWNYTGGYNGLGAYEFDRINDVINVSYSDSLNITGNITISTWINIKSDSLSDIISKYDGTNWQYVLLYANSDDTLRFYVGDATPAISSTVALNVWYHVVGVHNGTDTMIYVNNVKGTDDATPTNPVYASTDLLFGARAGGSRWFNGTIDEVRIYNRSLSAEEIKRLYELREKEPHFIGELNDFVYFDDSNDRVGIGTTTPTQTLTVAGDLNVTGLIYGNGSQLTDVSTSVSADSIDGAELADTITLDANMNVMGYNFSINASDLFVDVNTGRVGIGTTSPDYTLEINGSINVDGVAYFDAGAQFGGEELIVGASNVLHLGASGGTPTGADNTGDVYVKQRFEVGGITTLSGLLLSMSSTRNIGTSNYMSFESSLNTFTYTLQPNYNYDQFHVGLTPAIGMQWILGNYTNQFKDYDHLSQPNPTLYIQSATNPDTDNTQWLSMTHNTTNSVFESGNGSFVFKDNVEVTGNMTGNWGFYENLNISKNSYVGGCIKYNCSGASGCITLGTCI